MRAKLFLLWFSVFFVVGCGGGSGSTVATTAGAANAPTAPLPDDEVATGSVTFSFVRAQIPLPVPAATTRLHFVFTAEARGEGSLVLEATRDFAASITISNVPTTARSVRVTAADSAGASLLTSVAALTVSEDQTTAVTFPTFETVVPTALMIEPATLALQVGGTRQLVARARLSDGSVTVPTAIAWSSIGSAALVDGSGLVTATAPGNATVTASLGALSAQASVTVTAAPPAHPGANNLTRFTLDRDRMDLDAGTSVVLTAVGTFSNGTVRPLTNARDGLTYESSDVSIVQVDDAGRANAEAQGTATITARVGSFQQTVSVTVRPDAGAEVPIFTPQIFGETAIPQGQASFSILDTVSIQDSQSDFTGGSLHLDLLATAGGIVAPTAVLHTPSAPNIGTVIGDGTRDVTVQLTSSATPAAVATFLRGVTATVTGPQGDAYLSIELDDGQGHIGQAFATYNIRSQNVLTLTVDPLQASSSTNYTDVQAAVDYVQSYGADGSTVTLAARDFRVGTTYQGNYSLANSYAPAFTVRGANAGVRAGTSPQTRGSETIVSSFGIDPGSTRGVTFDGLTFSTNQTTSLDGAAGLFVFTGKVTVRNCIFSPSTTPNLYKIGIESYSFDPLTVEDCRFDQLSNGLSIYGYHTEIQTSTFVGLTGQAVFLSPGPTDDSNPSLVLEDSGFHDNHIHLQLSTLGAVETQIAGNEFSGTGVVQLDDGSLRSLDVRNNWWGQSAGALPAQLNNQSGIVEILTTPFLTSDPLPSFP